jgi:hypothetical protein
MSMRRVLCSASLLSISIAAGLLPTVVGQAHAQAPSQAGSAATPLPPVHVEAPQQRATARSATRSNSKRGRVSRANTSTRQVNTAEASPQSQGQQQAPATPLNTNVVTLSASRLGLTRGKYPQPLRWSARIRSGSKGYHTTIDTVKGATGATAGDALNHVSYAMRGFQGNQINVTTTASISARRLYRADHGDVQPFRAERLHRRHEHLERSVLPGSDIPGCAAQLRDRDVLQILIAGVRHCRRIQTRDLIQLWDLSMGFGSHNGRQICGLMPRKSRWS